MNMENCPVVDPYTQTQHIVDPVLRPSLNKYVYFRQDFMPATMEQQSVTPKVLLNPHFNKKVFLNPNYRPSVNHQTGSSSTIHINPRIQSIKPPEANSTRKILVNPKVLRNIPTTVDKNLDAGSIANRSKGDKQLNGYVPLSSEDLIQPPSTQKRIRRLSVRSKFKIVRSNSKCKGTGSDPAITNKKYEAPLKIHRAGNKFKLDNRKKNTSIIAKKTKFVFVNKFSNLDIGAKIAPFKINKLIKNRSSNLLNISGTVYKISPNSLRRISGTFSRNKRNALKVQDKPICKSKYKLIRSLSKIGSVEEKKNARKSNRRLLKNKKAISVEKLKKCNIPCPYYRKFGKCRKKELGKCSRKHDPDQIALCTKFLQGACIDDNCLLSHNVSSEKMPTCKFYLEGNCSRDHCPYAHVRISPKADICRDFLEGFCKKALECDKRHQFLCPDYEKRGCVKPRCPYPHGKMVRKYSVFNKNKFAKKSSNNVEEKPREKLIEKKEITKSSKDEKPKSDNARYYQDDKKENKVEEQNSDELTSSVNNETLCDQEILFRCRPKLGELPSFIAFDEKQ